MVRCASGVFFVRPAKVNMYWRVAASKHGIKGLLEFLCLDDAFAPGI